MKSHELAKLLLTKPDVELILQKDAEGTGYSPLLGVEFGIVYVPYNTWSGECYSTNFQWAPCGFSEEEWERLKKTDSAFAVLVPVN